MVSRGRSRAPGRPLLDSRVLDTPGQGEAEAGEGGGQPARAGEGSQETRPQQEAQGERIMDPHYIVKPLNQGPHQGPAVLSFVERLSSSETSL